MYSVEYMCTKRDMLVTTTSITAVNPSYSNPTLTIAQSHSSIYVALRIYITSMNIKRARIHVIAIFATVTIEVPLLPSFLPNIPATNAPKRGNQTIVIYIITLGRARTFNWQLRRLLLDH